MYSELSTAVGGHSGILQGGGSEVLKPLKGERGINECLFYTRVSGVGEEGDEEGPPPEPGAARECALLPPATFMPRYFGVRTLEAGAGVGGASALPLKEEGGTFMALEDLTKPFHRPCVLDVKMGVQSWDEDAPTEKVERERSKWSAQAHLGLRLTGMRVAEGGEGKVVERGREYCRQLPITGDEGLVQGILDFLPRDPGVRQRVAAAFLARLGPLVQWFEGQCEHRFYSSSLLFIYEGGGEVVSPPTTPKVDLRMIDFAHVWPIQDGPEGRDTGYLLGLQSLQRVLTQMCQVVGDAVR